MTSKLSKQMLTGKSFEYALLIQFEEKLRGKTTLEVIKNSAFFVAQDCFEYGSDAKKSDYMLSASFAVNSLMDIEPRLSHDMSSDDILQLEILSDDHGKAGDVRDILAIRLVQKWEIGVSAKNNHNAVKHSRLSKSIDFGEKWLGMGCSKEYFDTITPIFCFLETVKQESHGKKTWKELKNSHPDVYLRVLTAFMEELRRLYVQDPVRVASNLVSYLVGNKDFYKVIKRKNTVEIHAYNLYGMLNLPFCDIQPKYVTPKIVLPTEIVSIENKENPKKSGVTTVIVTMNHDWILSFRIHSASSRVESSLKFDVQLLSAPKTLFKNTLNIPQD